MDVGRENDDDETAAVLRTVGRVIKSCRERAGLRQAELGAAIGYSEEQVSAVERGRRVPKPEFLDAADGALTADGLISGLKKDVETARYPKKARDLAKLEAESVELGAYANHTVAALLQTEEYARTLFGMRRPAHPDDIVEGNVAARMARQEIIAPSRTVPGLSFVQEEVTLRRPIGGRMVQRRQLERLLEVGQFRNVEIQIMPTDRDDHAGLEGPFRLFKLRGGTTLGYSSFLISDPAEVQSLEMQYGIIRAQALSPRESLAFIDGLLGET
ncbi:helix-turn-helix transcriptional regulator [Streptomyces sp. NPDC047117]|uniref:helix-turn-helix domain-containing protein n=1 Tax=Streptomyces sp. NPDC047117 TaxID=3155379 RepID=UPI0033F5A1B1